MNDIVHLEVCPKGSFNSSIDGELVEYFEEEKALAVLLANDQIVLNQHWWMKDKGWPKEACETMYVGVICNDVFMYACADAEEMLFSDLEEVYEHYIKDPMWGTAVWCIKKRKQKPIKPVYDKIQKSGIWNLDDINYE